MKRESKIIQLIVLTFFALPALAQTDRGGASLECKFLYHIEQAFLTYHIQMMKRDNELESRIIEQYLKELDPTKIYLTQGDVDHIRTRMKGLLNKTKENDCNFLIEAQARYLQKVKDRVAFVKKILGKDYKLDEKAEFVFDRQRASWPASDEQAHDFLRKYVHFQVANYVATDVKLKEARERVIRNYERLAKRITDETPEDIYGRYLNAFASALDPHSSYLSRDFFADFNIQMSLSLEGIGATLGWEDGFTKVEALVPGGAAARSGELQPGDKITAVGQDKGPMENVIDMDLKDVVKKIRGPKGTRVRLSILRQTGDKKERLEISIIRDKVNLEDEAASLQWLERKEGDEVRKLAVINLPSFYADSNRKGRSAAKDVKRLVEEAREKKADGLVLDLSTNGGGSLEDAVKIAGLFFKKGNVVKQSGRKGSGREQILADEDDSIEWSGPLVVLTSRMSASASEIVAGALQDYRRAVVIGGDHTFGKGSVQTVLPMPNDLGALKVTVGMFFIPGGKSTQHRGVEADIPLPGQLISEDRGEKSLDYSLPPASVPPFLSAEAKGSSGAESWQEIRPSWLTTLKARSEVRVAANPDFKKLIEDQKKAEERGKLIKVSEILKDKGETEKKARAARYGKREDRINEYLKRPDLNEAVNILNDLVTLARGKIPGPQASGQ
ncbi:MAG: S41 family peptidase [Bdellovibrionaceae bacterium]|nr:S41 family peptidase [Pseudobdellovibrionaceae bacterium]